MGGSKTAMEAALTSPLYNLSFLTILGNIIYIAANIYMFMLMARVLLTWINPNPYSPVMRFLSKVSDPLLNRARKILPFTLGGIDFSPMLAIIAVWFLGFVVGKGLILVGQGAPVGVFVPLFVMGALSLYLDFINLFLFLLRLFGSSRD